MQQTCITPRLPTSLQQSPHYTAWSGFTAKNNTDKLLTPSDRRRNVRFFSVLASSQHRYR